MGQEPELEGCVGSAHTHTRRSGRITHCQLQSKTDALLQEQHIHFALRHGIPISEFILIDNSGREERERKK